MGRNTQTVLKNSLQTHDCVCVCVCVVAVLCGGPWLAVSRSGGVPVLRPQGLGFFSTGTWGVCVLSVCECVCVEVGH